MAKSKIYRREFLQLANKYKPEKNDVSGMFISEKLDGTRCFWDGGVTRGMKTKDVPWAGIWNSKETVWEDDHWVEKTKIKPVATGLWSRYGNPIIAPDWFLNDLPAVPLDGELWAGRGNFQLNRSIVAGDTPDPRFDQITYNVYGVPSIHQIFKQGLIKNQQMVRWITDDILKWFLKRIETMPGFELLFNEPSFGDELCFMNDWLAPCQHAQMHLQHKLPDDREEAAEFVETFLKSVLDKGGEGVVIRDPNVVWTPKRHNGLLKYKPYNDSEAVVIGYTAGVEGKQGNTFGKIGALRVRWNGVEFDIGSGMKLWERDFEKGEYTQHAKEHPGEVMPQLWEDGCPIQGAFIKIGDTITFKYRELSDDGIPKEAHYWRQRCDE